MSYLRHGHMVQILPGKLEGKSDRSVRGQAIGDALPAQDFLGGIGHCRPCTQGSCLAFALITLTFCLWSEYFIQGNSLDKSSKNVKSNAANFSCST